MIRTRDLAIAGRSIGSDHPPYVIAEIGINHNGDRALALSMLRAAHKAGADAVKFQAFTPNRLFNSAINPAAVALFDQWALTREDFTALDRAAAQLGIPFLCTPFDREWVAFLHEELKVPAFKVASSDCTNAWLLEAIGATGKPVILSTGMATLDEVALGVRTLREAGCPSLVLLHCVTQYPPEADEINLRAIQTLHESFEWPVGFSDHWIGNLASLGAIAAGACVIEKHFTTDRTLEGPDQAGSADPAGLASLVSEARLMWQMQGDGVKEAKGREVALRTGGRPGLYAVADLTAGHRVIAADVYAARPQGGVPASRWGEVAGMELESAIGADQAIEVTVGVEG
ncbi:MAG: N-acetylneuraminate synthase family protein [bacterium]